MARLPPAPEIEWKPDGTPVARGFGDVYFSTEDGLNETRAVFLEGCGLPESWAGREQFTVAETGFGTGLNFLALWQLWRAHRPTPAAWLHFVSFEGYPLLKEDAARALSAWPELADLSQTLLTRWPDRARGVRRLNWPDDGISLTLHIDDIATALPQADFAADAWFLDGFSPARNETMWDEALFPLIAERSAPGARAATFTVAGDVRRGLSGAGFEVEKRPGHGRKRERLEARLVAPPVERAPDPLIPAPSGEPTKTVAILGAGIAGAALARALMDSGVRVTVFDPAEAPASGASGNPLGLVMPRLDAGDTVQARLMVDAYLAARVFYAGRSGVVETEVRQTPKDEAETQRFASVLADPPLSLEDLEAMAGGGLLHKRALIVRPGELVNDLLSGADVRLGETSTIDLDAREVNGQTYDAILLSSGPALNTVAPWLVLIGKLGQVEHASGLDDSDAYALASGQYAIAAGDERLWGATYETLGDDKAIATSPAAREKNATALERLAPWWRGPLRTASIQSRASVRATTADRLPVAGPLPDVDRFLELFAGLRTGRPVVAEAPDVEGVWLVGGLGSRGFTFAPWLAEMVAAALLGEPSPLRREARAAVSPARILLRGLKRNVL